MDESLQIAAACQAMTLAYAPYSHFCVGAALLGIDGTLYTGCNVENVSYGLTLCAERTAVFKGVSSGCRRFQSLVLVATHAVTPCGACLQVLNEFCPSEMPIVWCDPTGCVIGRSTLGEMLPQAFTL